MYKADANSGYCRCSNIEACIPHIRTNICPPYREPKEGGFTIITGITVHSKKWTRIVNKLFSGDAKAAENHLRTNQLKYFERLAARSK